MVGQTEGMKVAVWEVLEGRLEIAKGMARGAGMAGMARKKVLA